MHGKDFRTDEESIVESFISFLFRKGNGITVDLRRICIKDNFVQIFFQFDGE